MDIDYNIILNYLCNTKSNFSNKLNITENANNFNKFKNLFSSTYFRYGVHVYNNNNNNISFWCALLFCLDSKFITKNLKEIDESIESFKHAITNNEELNKIVDDEDIKDIVNNTLHPYFIEIICNFFKINILIFDFKNDEILSAYINSYFNPWRLTVYLANYDNIWEPIISNDKKYFSINNDTDGVLKNILLEDINYYNKDIKCFTINDNIKIILKDENILYDNIKTDNNTFISPEYLTENLTSNKLNKMKKDDLLKLINDLNINISMNKPRKIDLINIVKVKVDLI